MKKTFQDLIDLKIKYRENELLLEKEEDKVEIRKIGETLVKLKEEILQLEKEIGDDEEKPVENEPKDEEARGLKLTDVYNVNKNVNVDERGTLEYRTACMNYIQKGELNEILQFRNNKTGKVINYRADTPLLSEDLGVLLPSTVIQSIITELEKQYGTLYAKVKKMNIKGGVRIPIGGFGATFKRISETGAPTERQKAGSVTGEITFTYKLGEIRISHTLVESILTVEAFEKEVSKVIVKAYLKQMDYEILNGVDSAGEMEGILTELGKTDSKIKAENVIEFTNDEMSNWKQWQKKLFSKIPLTMRALKPEFLMTANTYEANIKTLSDDNNRPVYNETYNPIDGTERATFKGKEVTFIDEGLGIVNFDEATAGQIFGFYWIPDEVYGINTNLEFTMRKYFDEEKLEYVDRAILLNDGKIIDSKYLYVLKKK